MESVGAFYYGIGSPVGQIFKVECHVTVMVVQAAGVSGTWLHAAQCCSRVFYSDNRLGHYCLCLVQQDLTVRLSCIKTGGVLLVKIQLVVQRI
jgi:hypothetical protein